MTGAIFKPLGSIYINTETKHQLIFDAFVVVNDGLQGCVMPEFKVHVDQLCKTVLFDEIRLRGSAIKDAHEILNKKGGK